MTEGMADCTNCRRVTEALTLQKSQRMTETVIAGIAKDDRLALQVL